MLEWKQLETTCMLLKLNMLATTDTLGRYMWVAFGWHMLESWTQ